VVLPQETATFSWDDFRFNPSTTDCGSPPTSTNCVVAVGQQQGTYEAQVCYGRGFKAAGDGPASLPAGTTNIIENAVADQVTCTDQLEIDVPSYDVRYQFYMN
jgi:hypothetical protein